MRFRHGFSRLPTSPRSVPHPEHELDKQIAAIALVNDLTIVTRNVQHFGAGGVRLLDPFSASMAS
jgi:hypothetical protein